MHCDIRSGSERWGPRLLRWVFWRAALCKHESEERRSQRRVRLIKKSRCSRALAAPAADLTFLELDRGASATKSLVVTVYFRMLRRERLVALGGVHLPASTTSVPKNAGDLKAKLMPEGAIQSRTDFGSAGDGGPCPPLGDTIHTFTVVALDETSWNTRGMKRVGGPCRLRDVFHTIGSEPDSDLRPLIARRHANGDRKRVFLPRRLTSRSAYTENGARNAP